ncbi:glycosyltransferase family 61 protein [Haloplanus rallus]|nr:glycosyltransferase family 61 protein [Haloplanus rallus]
MFESRITAVERFRRAREIYREDGIHTLSNKTKRYLARNITDSLVEKYVMPDYHQYLIRSEDLKNQATQVWDLNYNGGLTIQEQRDLIPFSNDRKLQFRNLPTYTFDDPFVAELQDAYLVGEIPLALTTEGKIISDTIYFNADCKVGKKRIQRRIKSAMNASPLQMGKTLKTDSVRYNPPKISIASLVYTSYNNFCLWMERELPKLRGIERYEEETGENVKLIIPNSAPKYVYEALDILGRDNYMEWDGESLSIERLIVPSYPQPYPATLKWLRKNLQPNDMQSPVNADWIYISRQQSKGRKVVNFDEINQVLDEFGVEEVSLENMNLQEQISTFQQVDGIIGPHGAGLVGMIWTKNLCVIEIFNEMINAPFYILAHILDHDYEALLGKGIGDIRRNQNIVLNKYELRSILKESVDNTSSK